MDDLTPVTRDYPAYDNEFTGTIRKIVIGVGPMGEAFDRPRMAWPREGARPPSRDQLAQRTEPEEALTRLHTRDFHGRQASGATIR